jgi:hypothetical protein
MWVSRLLSAAVSRFHEGDKCFTNAVIVLLLSLNSCSNEDHAAVHDAFHLKTTCNGPPENIYPRHSPAGSPARITDDGCGKSAPGWSPEGDSVVYGLQLGQQELWLYPTR